MRDSIIQRMSALAADARSALEGDSNDQARDALIDLTDVVDEFLASLSENASHGDRYAAPMRVRADQVMLGDVVVFDATPGSSESYLGTVYATQLLNEDVELKFHGPQMQDREVLIGARRQVSIVRMVERQPGERQPIREGVEGAFHDAERLN